MHLIQILLPPLYDNRERRFERSAYAEVQKELTNRFGGLTAFTRAPAQGLWKNEGDMTYYDIVVLTRSLKERKQGAASRANSRRHSTKARSQGDALAP